MITNLQKTTHDITVPLRLDTTSYDRDGKHFTGFSIFDASTEQLVTNALVSICIVDNALLREYEVDFAEVTREVYDIWMKSYNALRYANYSYEKRCDYYV